MLYNVLEKVNVYILYGMVHVVYNVYILYGMVHVVLMYSIQVDVLSNM